MTFITETDLTCPVCGFVEKIEIPTDYWLLFHRCARCGAHLKAKAGDCCVICSYGEHHCISRQREQGEV